VDFFHNLGLKVAPWRSAERCGVFSFPYRNHPKTFKETTYFLQGNDPLSSRKRPTFFKEMIPNLRLGFLPSVSCRDARSGRPPSGGAQSWRDSIRTKIPSGRKFHPDENGIIPHPGGGRPDRASLQ
jgi:hypothetical protein